jgi:hypothetical protein
LGEIDLWLPIRGMEPLEDTFERFCKNTYPFRHFIAAHRGRAAEQAPLVPAPLDLLFLDGDHSYEAVQSDLAHSVPKLKPGGWLLMHDYHTCESCAELQTNTWLPFARPTKVESIPCRCFSSRE